MLSEFLFKRLDCVGPVDWFGRLVAINDRVTERSFQNIHTENVIELQMFVLDQSDRILIDPDGIGRQPMGLEVQSAFTRLFLFLEPAFELFGACVVPLSRMEITICT